MKLTAKKTHNVETIQEDARLVQTTCQAKDIPEARQTLSWPTCVSCRQALVRLGRPRSSFPDAQ